MSLTRLPSWAYTLAAMLPPIAIAFIVRGLESPLRELLIAIAFLWLVAFTLYAWVRLDEAGREAHKFAWFWGGAFSLIALQLIAFGALFAPAIGQPISAFVESQTPGFATTTSNLALTGFFVGVFSAAIFQVAGYGLVWAGWWLSRRAGR